MPCVWILPTINFEERRKLLTCWCSVPAHPPEGEREPQANEFHFISNHFQWREC